MQSYAQKDWRGVNIGDKKVKSEPMCIGSLRCKIYNVRSYYVSWTVICAFCSGGRSRASR